LQRNADISRDASAGLRRVAPVSEFSEPAGRLRSITEQFDFPQVGRITVSIGFTEIRRGDSPSSAFERADKAVYYAKEHGRNQVCDHEALVAQGKLAAVAVNVGDIELF
jgi:GGDEF domain-containing protein